MTELRRDRLTWVVYASLGVYGFFIYSFGPTVPLLREDQGTSRAVSGLHSTALAVGAVVSGLLFARLSARVGRGRLMSGGLIGVAAGILLYVSADVLALTLLGALLCGTCGATVVNATAPVLTDHHGQAGPASISEGNALATASGAVAPLVVGAAVAVGLGWRAGMLVTLLGIAAVLLLGRGVAVPDPPGAGSEEGTQLPRDFWMAWAVLVLCIGVEFSVTVWASDLLRQQLGMVAATASASLTAVIVGMTLGRVIGARLMLRHSLERLLLLALGVAAVGFAILWTAPAVGVAVLGLFVLGLGMGAHYPLSISRAIAFSSGRPDLAAGRASIGAGLAIGTAPFVLGALADAYGTRTAFLLVPVLLGTAAAILLATGSGWLSGSRDGEGRPAAG